MKTEQDLKNLSKYLSYVLRHSPEAIQLSLDKHGWADVEQLLNRLNVNGYAVDRELLVNVVVNNPKKRFAFNEDTTLIRASQGHSIPIDLDYKPAEPPAILYHGTAEKNVEAILRDGLYKMQRHHVHLSADIETAMQVGQRYGRPVLFSVNAREMLIAGHIFYCSENGVWLTDSVPPSFLSALRP